MKTLEKVFLAGSALGLAVWAFTRPTKVALQTTPVVATLPKAQNGYVFQAPSGWLITGYALAINGAQGTYAVNADATPAIPWNPGAQIMLAYAPPNQPTATVAATYTMAAA
jgi:hypothetical protein